MRVTALSLADFRSYASADLELADGVTAVVGGNAAGKTSLLEAIGWAALGKSFRGVHDSALVRSGAEQAVVRADVRAAGDRHRTVEAEVRAVGRNRILVDKHSIARTRDLLDCLRVTVFAPDDLSLVKGAPGGRRDYLDDLLMATAPRFQATCKEYEKIVRQRNALLKGGLRDPDARATLAVFDDQLVQTGSELVVGRLALVARLGPLLDAAYRALAPATESIGARYAAEWAEGGTPEHDSVPELMRGALAQRHRQEVDRGLTLVGPHRDEWRLEVGGFDSRTQASQGEQRTLALSMRLAGHRLTAEVLDDPPVLLLDDVFSELDPDRADALVRELPPGQTIVTTAGVLPDGVHAQQRVQVGSGRLVTE
ncbi:MAG: DNA replication/repair protein RecF [Actinobacteria bacterium]|nr:DNA replication/repair protein RecF [Actinomycetota bacterium]